MISSEPNGPCRAKNVEQLIQDILVMKALARSRGYVSSALRLIISEEAYYQLRAYPSVFDRRHDRILDMDYYVQHNERGYRDLSADILIKTRLAHYEDIPPANADQPIQPRRRVPEPTLMKWEF